MSYNQVFILSQISLMKNLIYFFLLAVNIVSQILFISFIYKSISIVFLLLAIILPIYHHKNRLQLNRKFVYLTLLVCCWSLFYKLFALSWLTVVIFKQEFYMIKNNIMEHIDFRKNHKEFQKLLDKTLGISAKDIYKKYSCFKPNTLIIAITRLIGESNLPALIKVCAGYHKSENREMFRELGNSGIDILETLIKIDFNNDELKKISLDKIDALYKAAIKLDSQEKNSDIDYQQNKNKQEIQDVISKADDLINRIG